MCKNSVYLFLIFVQKALVMRSNLIQAMHWVQTQSGPSRCFLEQETLHSLLSTGWFQERIQECFYIS